MRLPVHYSAEHAGDLDDSRATVQMYALGDTIAAVATAAGEASLAVVRLSGPATAAILARVFRRPGGRPLPARQLRYGRLVDPASGEVVDEAMAVLLPGPATYTRETMGELHCHGGAVAPRRALAACLAAGARAAEPGELTLRAFLNGRLDLARAEAVLDVVQARTDAQMRLAQRGLAGRLTEPVRALRGRALDLLAQLTATIDFPDDDVPAADVEAPLAAALADLRSLRARAHQGLVLRRGARVAIVGRPNVGKSSLLNALLGSERAIVTPVPGTTRDTLEETANLDGLPVTLVDTAGLGPSDDPVERIGIARARAAARDADALLVVLDRSRPIEEQDRSVLAMAAGGRAVVALNKADLAAAIGAAELADAGLPTVAVSATRGQGLAPLQAALLAAVGAGPAAGDEVVPANARHEAALAAAEEALTAASRAHHADAVAAALAAAVEELGAITGESASDELLETIFSRFCIGK
jgi:tRNA modification GTPase